MGFRFRRSARLGPLRFHFTSAGLSSISLGGRGASLNLPVNRRGAPRATYGLPGTGLSWSVEQGAGSARDAAGAASALPAPPVALPNSRRLRPTQLESLRQHCLQLLQQRLFAPGSMPRRLWDDDLVSRLLADPSLRPRQAAQLALIETPEAMESYLQRARSQDDLKSRAQRCVAAVEEALRLCGSRGWLT